MIPHPNRELCASVVFFVVCKILCFAVECYRASMHDKRQAALSALTSIPEKNENDEEAAAKWVPKRKHEALKAKYKCLKKLFQIYDASFIGMLPDAYQAPYDNGYYTDDLRSVKSTRRKKRSHRTKTDACANTTEQVSSADVTRAEVESMTTLRNLTECSKTTVVQAQSNPNFRNGKLTATRGSNACQCSQRECGCTQTDNPPHPRVPYLLVSEKCKPSRFQCFVQRLLGLKPERCCPNYVVPSRNGYASSDNIYKGEKKRKRGLRFRSLRRSKLDSESSKGLNRPALLSYVQSVQRNCLMDTNKRQCPIVGCNMMLYGIINYNDHLNLCHFVERQHVCHYCHAGFEREPDKTCHEHDHLGLGAADTLATLPSTERPSLKRVSVTQTDPPSTEIPEEKLKNIVSFFDKINDSDQMLVEMKKKRHSESNLHRCSNTETLQTNTGNSSGLGSVRYSDKTSVSCGNLAGGRGGSEGGGRGGSEGGGRGGSERGETAGTDCSEHTRMLAQCPYCEEQFQCRRQLSLHVELEHMIHDKYSKFNRRVQETSPTGPVSGTGHLPRVNSSTLTHCSEGSCDPSTNIVYYTSMASLTKLDSPHGKGSCISSYKWVPGSRIIRV